MSSAIYLIQSDGALVEMTTAPYDSESVLQELLAKYPSVLAGQEADADTPRRWILVAREVGIPGEEGGTGRFALDHLFLDQDGVPTLVEVKRRSDTRIRREVVGQMLDYAANAVVYWPLEDIKVNLARTHATTDASPDTVLLELLGPDGNVEQFWRQVEENLRVGNIRLVFVADELPAELRRVIEFLNEQMSPAEVLGVEVQQFVAGELRTLVPRVFGLTRRAEARKGGATGQSWKRETFLAAVREQTEEPVVDAVRRLLDVCERIADDIGYGKGQTGSFSPKFPGASSKSFFTVWTNGDIQINRKWHERADAGAQAVQNRNQFIATLRHAGLAVPETPYPTLRARAWLPAAESVIKAVVEQFGRIEPGPWP